MIKWCFNSPVSSSSSSLTVAEVLIHSIASAIFTVGRGRAVKAASIALEKCRREGEGTEKSRRGGGQGRS